MIYIAHKLKRLNNKPFLDYINRFISLTAEEETEHKDVPLFVDIISRDESGEGWETERRPLNIGNSE